MIVASIVLLLGAVVLLVVALAIRFAGPDPVLAGLRRGEVADMAALNRAVGTRLLLLPVVAAAFGAAGLRAPLLGLLGLAVTALVGVVVMAWLMLFVERHRRPAR